VSGGRVVEGVPGTPSTTLPPDTYFPAGWGLLGEAPLPPVYPLFIPYL